MRTINIHITNMICDHCAQNIQSALNGLDGVTASVSYRQRLARVEIQEVVAVSQLLEMIQSKGYDATLFNNDGTALHIVIIGTGSAAFAAAIKAVELGAMVTVIESAEVIGGTCVNTGCLPSKIFIRGAYIAHLQEYHRFNGVPHNRPKIDRKAMITQQQKLVQQLRYTKYEHILASNPEINLIRGRARFKDTDTLIVTNEQGTEKEIQADRFLLAVGACASIPDIPGLKDTPYWTSTEALNSAVLPKHLLVLGASIIALELAQAFHYLGTDVTILARSTLLSKEEPAIGAELLSLLTGEGINVMLNTSTESVKHDGKQFIVQTNHGEVRGDRLLLATGRVANTTLLGLDKIAVKTDKLGGIIIDDHMRTSVENIYAAGDCSNQPRYVYVAAAAGTRAAINMMGGDQTIDLSTMPTVVFTNPQVGTVGLSEQQANASGLEVVSRTLNLGNVPRALANRDTRGFIKLVAEKDSGRIVGCQIVAHEGGEIIQTAALAIRNKMTIEELSEQLFPYLTMVEGLKLTAQMFTKDVQQLSCCAG